MINQDNVAALSAEVVDQFRASHYVDRFKSEIMRDMNYGPASRRIRRVLNHPVAASEIDVTVQQSPRGYRVDFQHRCMNWIDFRRNGHEFARFYRDCFAPG